MPRNIPFLHFEKPGAPKLHFAHANGYPPQAYSEFLSLLSEQFDVWAMESRALWPDASPESLEDWGRLEQDLLDFLADQGPWFGVGHSVGGTATLMAALKRPDLFKAIAILDPPFFTPAYSRAWRWVVRLGLEKRLHPLAPTALRRRQVFENKQAMFDNYRSKNVFRKISDQGLWAYVDSLAVPADSNGIRLRYSPDWEARIYTRGMLADSRTWQRLPSLQLPTLFLRAEHSNAFYASTVRKIRRLLPDAELAEIPGASHLFPLEKPIETAQRVFNFLKHPAAAR